MLRRGTGQRDFRQFRELESVLYLIKGTPRGIGRLRSALCAFFVLIS